MTVDEIFEYRNNEKNVTVTFNNKEYELFKRVFTNGEFDKNDIETAMQIYLPIKDLS